jgi:hypothetical protein
MFKLNPKRLILFLLGAAVLLYASARASAGEFTLLQEDDSLITYSYTGTVNTGDSRDLRDLHAGTSKDVVIVIDSPGGAAYEGVDLYWATKELGTKTVAGNKFGAYSAAALFWLGGSGDMINGSLAGFHLAYYTSWNPPGGDTADIDGAFFKILVDAYGRHEGAALWMEMQAALDAHGTNGFVLMTMVDGERSRKSLRLTATAPSFLRMLPSL